MFEKILAIVTDAAPHLAPAVDENSSPKAIRIHPDDIVNVCNHLYQNKDTYFDLLSCITGIDNGPATGTIEIAYNLYSIPYDIHLMLKVAIPRDNSEVDSVTSVWR